MCVCVCVCPSDLRPVCVCPADLMVEKLRLNVHIPLLLVLMDFFTTSLDTGTIIDAPDVPATPRAAAGVDISAGGASSTSFNVYGSLKQPEIILYTDPTSADSKAFILYVSVHRVDPLLDCFFFFFSGYHCDIALI